MVSHQEYTRETTGQSNLSWFHDTQTLIRNATPPKASKAHISVVVDIFAPFTAALAIKIVPQVPASVVGKFPPCAYNVEQY